MQIQELQLPGRLVMVKRATNADQLVKLRNESAILSGLFLPGVVRLIESPPPLDVNGIRVAKVGPSLDLFRPLTPLEVAAVVSSLARTIAHLQDLQVIHGAIDSTHVLIGADGRPVLCSFGRMEGDLNDDVRALGHLIYALLQPQRSGGIVAPDDAEQTRARVVLLEIADSTVHAPTAELPYPDEIADLIDQHIPLRQLPMPDGIPMPQMPQSVPMPAAQEQPPTVLTQTLTGISHFPAPSPAQTPQEMPPHSPPHRSPVPQTPAPTPQSPNPFDPSIFAIPQPEPQAYVAPNPRTAPPASPQQQNEPSRYAEPPKPAAPAPSPYQQTQPSPYAEPPKPAAPAPSPYQQTQPSPYAEPPKPMAPAPSPFQVEPGPFTPPVQQHPPARTQQPEPNPFGEPSHGTSANPSVYSSLSDMGAEDDRFDASWFMDDEAPIPSATAPRSTQPHVGHGPPAPNGRMRSPRQVDIPEKRSSLIGTFIFGGAIVAVVGIAVVIFAFLSGGAGDKAEVLVTTTTNAATSTTSGGSSTTSNGSSSTTPTTPGTIPPVSAPPGVQQGRCAPANDNLEIDVDGDGCSEITKIDTKQISGSNGSTITVPVLHVFQNQTEVATLTMVTANDKFTAGHWGSNVSRTAATFNASNGCIFAFDTWTDPTNFPPRAVAQLANRNVVSFESRPAGSGTSDLLVITFADGSVQQLPVPALPTAPAAEQCG